MPNHVFTVNQMLISPPPSGVGCPRDGPQGLSPQYSCSWAISLAKPHPLWIQLCDLLWVWRHLCVHCRQKFVGHCPVGTQVWSKRRPGQLWRVAFKTAWRQWPSNPSIPIESVFNPEFVFQLNATTEGDSSCAQNYLVTPHKEWWEIINYCCFKPMVIFGWFAM